MTVSRGMASMGSVTSQSIRHVTAHAVDTSSDTPSGPAGRRQVNLLGTRKREHSRKPGELYYLIEACSPGSRLELFARGSRPGWTTWGDQAVDYAIGWETYAHNSGGAGVWAEAAE